jgi:hypothetical protein
MWGEAKDTLFLGGDKGIIFLLEGTQAMTAHPDKDRVRMKTLGWCVNKGLEAQTAEFCFHKSLINVEIIWKFK